MLRLKEGERPGPAMSAFTVPCGPQLLIADSGKRSTHKHQTEGASLRLCVDTCIHGLCIRAQSEIGHSPAREKATRGMRQCARRTHRRALSACYYAAHMLCLLEPFLLPEVYVELL